MNRNQKERLISEIETLIRRDPARRGLIGADGDGPGKGELARAATFLTESPTAVGLITGFFVPQRNRLINSARQQPGTTRSLPNGNAETDGPPGTAVLADVLTALDIPVTVITDELCEPVVRTACANPATSHYEIIASPTEIHAARDWRAQMLNEPSFRRISHFIAIERVGPGHITVAAGNSRTPEYPNATASTDDAWQPGHCCNMRGESIEAFSANIHLLVEAAVSANPNAQVIGVGDGGNEIGMGRFSWEELRARLSGPNADRVPCRTPADATIVAGVSNWGAYALASAVAIHHDRIDLLNRHSTDSQQQLLQRIVQEAGAVDGVTRQRQATVDGLPFLTQIQPWIAIRERLGMTP